MRSIRAALLLLLLLPLASGCITMAGDRLGDLEPDEPPRAPHLEQTVGDFSFHLDGGKLVTSNKMGRLVNDEILLRWQEAGFISGHSYVKSSEFSGRAEYNLTLSGHQEGDSSVFMQVLSGLTLFLIPYWVNTDMDLRYTLEHVPTGRSFEAEAADDHTMVVSLLLLPAAPFTQGGRSRTMDRLAAHLYEQLRSQGAFDPESWPEADPGATGAMPAGADARDAAQTDAAARDAAEDGTIPQEHDPADRLRRLEALRDEGLLGPEEYEAKRQEILDDL